MLFLALCLTVFLSLCLLSASLSPSDYSVGTICGSGSFGELDGDCSTAKFETLSPAFVDSLGQTAYVADTLANRIRAISLSDSSVSTIAGDGSIGHLDGPANKANFTFPYAVCGNPWEAPLTALFVLDSVSGHRVRYLNFSDSTVGTLSLSGSAPAGGAMARDCVVTSKPGQLITLLLADTVSIYELSQTAPNSLSFSVSELIPSGSTIFSGPHALAMDYDSDILYFLDRNMAKRMNLNASTPASTIEIIAGGASGRTSANSTDGNAFKSAFEGPRQLSIDAVNQIVYVADPKASNIRAITFSQNYSVPAGYNSHATAYTIATPGIGPDGQLSLSGVSQPSGAVFAPSTGSILIVSEGAAHPVLRNISSWVAPDDLDSAGPLVGWVVGSFTVALLLGSVLMFFFKLSFFRPDTDYYGVTDESDASEDQSWRSEPETDYSDARKRKTANQPLTEPLYQ